MSDQIKEACKRKIRDLRKQADFISSMMPYHVRIKDDTYNILMNRMDEMARIIYCIDTGRKKIEA